MNQEAQETDTKTRYLIPEILERENQEDFPLITGSGVLPKNINDLIVYFNKNITSPSFVFPYSKISTLIMSMFGNLDATKHNFTWQFSEQRDVIKPALAVVSSFPNKDIAKEASIILNLVRLELQPFNELNLPAIHVIDPENGSLIMEWIFQHFRIGFSLEPEKKDSGWFLVTDETFGWINANGLIETVNISRIMTWILSFVVIHNS